MTTKNPSDNQYIKDKKFSAICSSESDVEDFILEYGENNVSISNRNPLYVTIYSNRSDNNE